MAMKKATKSLIVLPVAMSPFSIVSIKVLKFRTIKYSEFRKGAFKSARYLEIKK